MRLFCLSISHHNSPLEVRECLTLPEASLKDVYERYSLQSGLINPLDEMVILSTCNRLEIYIAVSAENHPPVWADNDIKDYFRPLWTFLEDVTHTPAFSIEPFGREFIDIQAVKHLHRVAAGLDSIAIGETQILGQVSKALDAALSNGSAGHTLSLLFRSAIQAGKRVRTETNFGRQPINISTLAVQFSTKILGALHQKKILVVGAGKMGSCTLEALKTGGVKHIYLTNRTSRHTKDVVSLYGGTPLAYEDMVNGIAECSVMCV